MIVVHQVRERSAFTVMMRVHVDGEDAVESDVDSITYAVYPQAGGSVVDSGSLVVADVMFDELQTDSMWDADATGYNFSHNLDHTTITSDGTYVIEYKFTCGATVFYCEPIVVKATNVYSA